MLAGIVADLTGDGHIRRGLVQFISKDKCNTLNFKKRVESIFGVDGYIRPSPTTPGIWECVFGGNFLPRMLMLAGTPFGNKTSQDFSVPSWVMHGEDTIKSTYLRRLFDCEGSVNFQKRNRVRIRINMWKDADKIDNMIEYLEQVRLLLKEFGVNTTNVFIAGTRKYSNGRATKGVEFEAYGTRKNMSSIVNYQRNIGFDYTDKQQRLKTYIGNLSVPCDKPR